MGGVRKAFPEGAVRAGGFGRRQLVALDGGELNGMVREVWESAILLGRMALEKLGVEGGQIDRIDLEYRRRDEERLALQSVSGDLHSGNEMMFHRSGPLPAATPVDAEDK